MEISMTEEQVVRLSLETELKRLRESCDQMRDELKKYTQGLKQSVKEKHEISVNEIAERVKKLIDDDADHKAIDKFISEKVIDLLSPIFGFQRDSEGRFCNDRHIICSHDGYSFIKDEAQNLVSSCLRKSISEYLDSLDIEKIVGKSLNGMSAEHMELVNFSRNLAHALKEELGEGIGDNASAKIVETISWEMKAQRDRKKSNNGNLWSI